MRLGVLCVWCGVYAPAALSPGGLCEKCQGLTLAPQQAAERAANTNNRGNQ